MHMAAVAMGEAFPAAEREGRPPRVADLWEEEMPLGPYIVTALRARELHKCAALSGGLLLEHAATNDAGRLLDCHAATRVPQSVLRQPCMPLRLAVGPWSAAAATGACTATATVLTHRAGWLGAERVTLLPASHSTSCLPVQQLRYMTRDLPTLPWIA